MFPCSLPWVQHPVLQEEGQSGLVFSEFGRLVGTDKHQAPSSHQRLVLGLRYALGEVSRHVVGGVSQAGIRGKGKMTKEFVN